MIYAEFFYPNPKAPASAREVKPALSPRVWLGAPSTPSPELHARACKAATANGYPLYRLVRVHPHLRKGEHASTITRVREGVTA